MDYSRKINLLDVDCTVSSNTSLLYISPLRATG